VSVFQSIAPVVALSAYNAPSFEPTYTIPFATSGEESTAPLVAVDQMMVEAFASGATNAALAASRAMPRPNRSLRQAPSNPTHATNVAVSVALILFSLRNVRSSLG
jgi:hypothetical protein